MPSAAGKRVGRVLAGCSKPEAGDKPGLHTWQGILGFLAGNPRKGHQECRSETLLQVSDSRPVHDTSEVTRFQQIPLKVTYV